MSSEPAGGGDYPGPLSDPAVRLEPFDWYREMRADSPVRYDPERPAWDVFRYEDVKAVTADPETFSTDPRVSKYSDPNRDASPMRETMLSADPPRHDRLRGVVDDLFTPEAVADLEPAIREFAADLADDVATGGGCDFVADVADPLSKAVVAELLGVPESDRDRFSRWVDAIVDVTMHHGSTIEEDRAARDRHAGTMQAMSDYFADALADRRADPRDDLVTRVATGTHGGEGLDVREMLGLCMLMMFGGTVTTKNLLANALWCLGDRPDLLATYEAGDGSVEGLVEETLRYRSPLQALARFTTEPTEFRGHSIDEGETVVFWLGSANRDGAVFDAPEEFRPDRSPNRHLAFGSGIHYCLGAPLARLEAEVALTEVFDRLSDIEVDTDGLEPIETASKLVYGVQSLPVSVDRTG